jgi:ABC-2 type transport system permease protein
VGLLLGLKAPVLTGPVGYLVAERLGTVGPLLGLGYLVLFGLLLTLLAATLFARRDR